MMIVLIKTMAKMKIMVTRMVIVIIIIIIKMTIHTYCLLICIYTCTLFKKFSFKSKKNTHTKNLKIEGVLSGQRGITLADLTL